MAHNDLIGFGLLIGYFVAMGLPMILLKAFDKVPFEVARKLYHLVIALSIFPMLKLFSSWYAAVLAPALLVGNLVGDRVRGVIPELWQRRIELGMPAVCVALALAGVG